MHRNPLAAILLSAALPALAQPCTPTTTFGPDGGSYVARVQFGGVFAIDHTTTFSPGVSYQDYIFSGPDRWARVQPGTTVPLSITAGPFVGTQYAAWIDLDGNDDFSVEELVAQQTSTSAGQIMTFSVPIPSTALKMVTRMRVRAAFNMTTPDPCANFLYGETEDYLVVLDDLAPCVPFATYGATEGDQITALNLAGTPFPAIWGPITAYANIDFGGVQLNIGGSYNFSVTSGSYAEDRIAIWVDWDGSGELGDDPSELIGTALTSTPFETVTFPFVVPTQVNVEPRQVRIRVRLWYGVPVGPCDDVAYGQTVDFSAAIQVPSCPCLPVVSTYIMQHPIGSVDIDGFSYASSGVNAYPYYKMNFTPGPALEQGSTHTLTVGTSTLIPETRVHVWLDANADLDFSDAGEYVGSVVSGPGGGLVSIPFTIPATSPVGHTFLRIRTTAFSPFTITNGCNTGGLNTGEFMDLRLTIEDPAGPCIPGNNQWTLYGDVINGVELNTLSNTGTGAQFGPEYTDYTAQNTTLEIGNAYTIHVTSGNSSPNGLGVWIDWNNDQDFDDADEAIGQTITGAPNETFSTTFTTPAVTPGPKRMRVRCWYGTTPGTACERKDWGETEDYTVVVETNAGITTQVSAQPKLIADGSVEGTVLLSDASWNSANVEVLDMSGRRVWSGTITSTRQAIALPGEVTGIYNLVLHKNDRSWSSRFAVVKD